MEVFVKIIVLSVIFTYVLAEDQDYNQPQSTMKPRNQTDEKEIRAAKLRKYIVDCTEETKVDPNYILNLRSGKWRQALRNQPWSLKKWLLCLLVKSNMMSPDGVLKQDMVLQNVPDKDKAKVEKVIDKCLYSTRHLPAEIAWHYVTCFRKNFSKYSII